MKLSHIPRRTFLTVLAGTVFAAVTLARAAPPQTTVLLSPEAVFGGNATLRPAAEGARIEFQKGDWPNVRFAAGKAYPNKDWSAIGGVAFDVKNPSDAPLIVNIRVDDSEKADGTVHCRAGSAVLGPGEAATLVFPMTANAPAMRAGPPLQGAGPKGRALNINGSVLDETNIVAFQIFLNHPDRPRDLDLKAIRFLPKPEMRGIVDRLGQYAHADWPGKVKNDAELSRRDAEEAAWLAAHPPQADRDAYGGWKNGPQLRATGFFRTAFVRNAKEQAAPPKPGETPPANGRWWLVTPTGHLFWSAGVTCVRPYSEGPIAGRAAMFSYLTDDMTKRDSADFYHRNLELKYGGDWEAKWNERAATRLGSWGFNTIANWSDASLFRTRKVPYVVPVYYSGVPYIVAQNEATAHGLPDFFDEKFPGAVAEAVQKGTAEWKKDPWCLGYFVDNELAWDTWAQMGTGGEYVVAREAIAAPATLAARKAFVKILQARYATPDAWAKAWGVDNITGWDAPVPINAAQLNAASRADCAAFSTALAERYFSVVRAQMKTYAPHQLYLGCRFAIRPQEIVTVAAKYCDVVSFNIYADTVDKTTWGFTETLGKPVVIGEFHFGATDRGLFHPGLRERPNQTERAKAYETYVRSVLVQPAFVGCHWFQYADEPLTGRFDGENYNIGFVTVTDTVYPEMRDAARRVLSEIYKPAGATRPQKAGASPSSPAKAK